MYVVVYEVSKIYIDYLGFCYFLFFELVYIVLLWMLYFEMCGVLMQYCSILMYLFRN